MLHLIKYNLLIKLRNFNMVFWPLVFPLIMATFFFFAFGNLNDADFETVQVALVKESANPVFVFFLDQVQSGDSELIALHEMSEKDALDALSQKKISGIYYEQAIPGLTLNGQGIPESILQSVLESYENNLHTLQTILKKHADTFNLSVKLTTIKDFGGWVAVQKKHFADGGVFDEIYEE